MTIIIHAWATPEDAGVDAATAAIIVSVARGVEDPPHGSIYDSIVIVLPRQLDVFVFLSAAAAIEVIGVIGTHSVHTHQVRDDDRNSLPSAVNLNLGVEEAITWLVRKGDLETEWRPPP